MNINEYAKEYFLDGSREIGIVLTHGFTSSPSYMHPAAEDLNKMGYSVYAPLLSGHGTKESDLRKGYIKNWAEDVSDGIKFLRSKGVKTVYCMGHSLGGVMSLIMAEQGLCDGLITVAAPMKIFDGFRVKLFSIFCKNQYHVMNKPDGKKKMFRYFRADGKSIGNLLGAMSWAKNDVSKVTVPTMVIVSTEDKTVKMVSGDIIYNGVSSDAKELVMITGNHSECIWESRNQYLDKINKFIEKNS